MPRFGIASPRSAALSLRPAGGEAVGEVGAGEAGPARLPFRRRGDALEIVPRPVRSASRMRSVTSPMRAWMAMALTLSRFGQEALA